MLAGLVGSVLVCEGGECEVGLGAVAEEEVVVGVERDGGCVRGDGLAVLVAPHRAVPAALQLVALLDVLRSCVCHAFFFLSTTF